MLPRRLKSRLCLLIAHLHNTNVQNLNLKRGDMFVMSFEEPVVEKAEALYYFEEFCIQPMRLNLSFVRTEKLDNEESR
jgi:hypothetical protein